jgi:hypothetical protein
MAGAVSLTAPLQAIALGIGDDQWVQPEGVEKQRLVPQGLLVVVIRPQPEVGFGGLLREKPLVAPAGLTTHPVMQHCPTSFCSPA